jgi:membrane dipeptidase
MRTAKTLLTLAGTLILPCLSFAQDIAVSSSARILNNSTIIIDTHEDTPQRFFGENYDIGSTDQKDLDFISLSKARARTLGAVFFSIWVYPATNPGHFAKRALELKRFL